MAGSGVLDMALDDIIKTNQPTRGGRGGRGRGTRGNSRGGSYNNQQRRQGTQGGAIRKDRNFTARRASPYQQKRVQSRQSDGEWAHDMYEDEDEEVEYYEEVVQQPARRVAVSSNLRNRMGGDGGASGGGAKLQVSNLEHSVTKDDLTELFGAMGSLEKVILRFDRSGRPNGIADVVFARKADAVKAVKEYQGLSIDGKPMAIALSSQNTPAQSVYERPVAVRTIVGGVIRQRPQQQQQQQQQRSYTRGGYRGGRGGSSGRGGRGGFRGRTQVVESSEDLDADIDSYMAA